MVKIKVVLVAVVATVVALSEGNDEHCPKNCKEDLANVCNQIEPMLENVPLLPSFVLDIVGSAICFPKDVKPNDKTLCPKKCGEKYSFGGSKDNKADIWKKTCYYVDDILQNIPFVPKMIRNLTDNAICAFGGLIDVNGLKVNEAVQAAETVASDSNDKHCPKNCEPELAKVCNKLEPLLENVPNMPEYVREIIGSAICFPKDVSPGANSLCPKKCAEGGLQGDKQDMFKKTCNYVDSILADIPFVTKEIRNLTDHAICALGSLVADGISAEKDLKVQSFASDAHCPKNCEKKLGEICEQVEPILENVPFLPGFVLDIVGDAICFPKDVKPNEKTLCPKKCAEDSFGVFGDDKKDMVKKVCYYVDGILQDIPTVPTTIRNLTDHAVCAIGKLIADGALVKQADLSINIQ